MTWKIVADSSCDIHSGINCGEGVTFSVVPLTIKVGEKEFVDTPDVDLDEMMKEVDGYKGASSSSCPSPDRWLKEFEGDEDENVIAVTMSNGLSGTHNSAVVAMNMVKEQFPNKKVYVIDSYATSGKIALIVWKVNELIQEGNDFETVVAKAEEYKKNINIFYTLQTFDNLVKAGRMNKIVGVLASRLKLFVIGGASDKGTIQIVGKSRGEANTLNKLVEMMKEKTEFLGKRVYITHCNNLASAEKLKSLIEDVYKGVEVTIEKTGALTSYYAEKQGMILCF